MSKTLHNFDGQNQMPRSNSTTQEHQNLSNNRISPEDAIELEAKAIRNSFQLVHGIAFLLIPIEGKDSDKQDEDSHAKILWVELSCFYVPHCLDL